MSQKFSQHDADNNFDRNFYQRAECALDQHPTIEAIRWVIEQANPKISAGAILEVGCSTGWVLGRLAQITPHCSLLGIDISPKAIKYAKEKYKHCEFQCSSLADLAKSKNKKFDLIILGFYLFLIPPEEWEREISSALAIIQPNGILCIYDFYSESTNYNIYKHNENLRAWKGPHLHNLESQLHDLRKIYTKLNGFIINSNGFAEAEGVTLYRVVADA